MAYKRKTIDTFEIQGYYREGWECETTEITWREAKAQLKIYRAEQPDISHRIKLVREKIEANKVEEEPIKYIGIRNRSALPTITIESVTYYVDFRLGEVRPVNAPYLAIHFKDLKAKVKAEIRGIRFRETSYGYIQGLDD